MANGGVSTREILRRIAIDLGVAALLAGVAAGVAWLV